MWALLRALVATGGSVALYASVVERNWFALRRHLIPVLPPGSGPLTILHLSDLHLRAVQRRKRRWLEGLAALEPDLVVVTGDMLGDADSTPAAVTTLNALPARLARAFVLGSNDFYSPVLKSPLVYFREHDPNRPLRKSPRNDVEGLIAGLTEAGWLDLSNRAVEIDGIDVVGLDDAHIGRADLSVATPRTGDGFRLAVTHSPDVVPDLARLGYDLIVAGHTHGGQVRVPGFGALVTNSHLPRQMARGLHRVEDAWLHVSAGLGTSMFAPYRFSCRPEACLLELVAR